MERVLDWNSENLHYMVLVLTLNKSLEVSRPSFSHLPQENLGLGKSHKIVDKDEVWSFNLCSRLSQVRMMLLVLNHCDLQKMAMSYVSTSLGSSWRRAWKPTPVFLPGDSPWTEQPGRLQSTGWEGARHDRATKLSTAQHWADPPGVSSPGALHHSISQLQLASCSPAASNLSVQPQADTHFHPSGSVIPNWILLKKDSDYHGLDHTFTSAKCCSQSTISGWKWLASLS